MKEKLERIFGKGNIIVRESEADTTYVIFGHDHRTVRGQIIADNEDKTIWYAAFDGPAVDFIRIADIIEESYEYEE